MDPESKDQGAGDLWELTIDDLFSLSDGGEPQPAAVAAVPYTIDLFHSTEPASEIAASLRDFEHLHVYQVTDWQDDRLVFRLRLGPIESELEADAILSIVSRDYPQATMLPLGEDDLRMIAIVAASGPARDVKPKADQAAKVEKAEKPGKTANPATPASVAKPVEPAAPQEAPPGADDPTDVSDVLRELAAEILAPNPKAPRPTEPPAKEPAAPSIRLPVLTAAVPGKVTPPAPAAGSQVKSQSRAQPATTPPVLTTESVARPPRERAERRPLRDSAAVLAAEAASAAAIKAAPVGPAPEAARAAVPRAALAAATVAPEKAPANAAAALPVTHAQTAAVPPDVPAAETPRVALPRATPHAPPSGAPPANITAPAPPASAPEPPRVALPRAPPRTAAVARDELAGRAPASASAAKTASAPSTASVEAARLGTPAAPIPAARAIERGEAPRVALPRGPGPPAPVAPVALAVPVAHDPRVAKANQNPSTARPAPAPAPALAAAEKPAGVAPRTPPPVAPATRAAAAATPVVNVPALAAPTAGTTRPAPPARAPVALELARDEYVRPPPAILEDPQASSVPPPPNDATVRPAPVAPQAAAAKPESAARAPEPTRAAKAPAASTAAPAPKAATREPVRATPAPPAPAPPAPAARDKAPAKAAKPPPATSPPRAATPGAQTPKAPAGPPPAIDSTRTMRALVMPEAARSAPGHLLVVQLVLSEQEIVPESVPNLAIFNEYRLYIALGESHGKVMYALRLGFFTDEGPAQAVAGYLRSYFEAPAVTRVSVEERERFAKRRVAARKDSGDTGVHTIELSSAPPVPPTSLADLSTTTKNRAPGYTVSGWRTRGPTRG